MPKPPSPTVEADGYLNGLYQELHQQTHRYRGLTQHLLELEAKVELAEKTVCLMRDHLAMAIARTDSATPRDWEKTFNSVRLVGFRLAEACVALLRERKKLTVQQLLEALNTGMFRFRTNAPLREIHAALLRQRFVKRKGNTWIWVGPADEEVQQQPLALGGRQAWNRDVAVGGYTKERP